ncbi:hypothetical protein BLA60_16195 [Actinophytocola xinjiangensis]|uniref:KAP NTPase domain-containing protein n=1 Tax=Actinophytocola xinjiangensis TaxID=485602 RepID=A0A7Z0WMU7_9PSEU|nr:P-loop NTPase fold protein [Actinophytocola xinjiangensis]OLF10702.1 hypothetical protein BLA60_16195 [Actinophytocola xinjiangensis]
MPLVHRTIIAVDIEGLLDANREIDNYRETRKGMYEVLRTAFSESGIELDICEVQDRGDGTLVLVPPDISKSLVADRLPYRISSAVIRHNDRRVHPAPLRLRIGVHAGDLRTEDGYRSGRAVLTAVRLVDADVVSKELRAAGASVAVIVSEEFYTQIIQPDMGTSPRSYQPVAVPIEDTAIRAWLRLFGSGEFPSESSSSVPAPRTEQPPTPDSDVEWRIGTRGFGDRPPAADLLRRGAMIDALADVITPPAHDEDPDRSGPTVIALDGPWGIGKTSLVELVRARLDPASTPPTPVGKVRPLRVFEADRALGGRGTGLWRRDMLPRPDTEQPPLITARFEPWAHQTSEQVWAGLTGTLLGAVEQTLLPRSAPATERYWFQRNLDRVDRMRLRRSLRRNVRSPLTAVSTLALAVPLIAAMARSTDTYRLAWLVDIAGSNIAVGLTLVMLLGAIGHSLVRYFTRPAADFLPAELFAGPAPGGSDDEDLRDPYHNADSGYLYLAQHDVFAVLADVQACGHHVVVFVDDLDRCTPRATAEVFEAINMFVTRTFPITRFVLCLDTTTVAAHLDHVYATLKGKVPHGDDPTPGWSFLRKLIQLPVTIPHIDTDNVTALLDDLLGTPASAPRTTTPPTAGTGDQAPEPIRVQCRLL